MNTLKLMAYVLAVLAAIAFVTGLITGTELYSGELAQLSIDFLTIYCLLKIRQMEREKRHNE